MTASLDRAGVVPLPFNEMKAKHLFGVGVQLPPDHGGKKQLNVLSPLKMIADLFTCENVGETVGQVSQGCQMIVIPGRGRTVG
jgi:hypothetical protein